MPVEPGSKIGAYSELGVPFIGDELVVLRRTTPSPATRYSALSRFKPYVATIDVNAQTGTTYTLVLADLGKLITLSNGAAITLTVPLDVFPVGAMVKCLQISTGVVTVAEAGGVTVNPPSGLTQVAFGQMSYFELIQYATNTWALFGDLAA